MARRRFKELVEAKYFEGCRLYRVIPGFIVQWGIPADPAMWKQWGENKIKVSSSPCALVHAHACDVLLATRTRERGRPLCLPYHPDLPGVSLKFHGQDIPCAAWQDDPVKVSNTKGTLSFATSGPNACV